MTPLKATTRLAKLTAAAKAPPVPQNTHFHLGGTEMNYATFNSLQEAESAVDTQALKWIARYGPEAVHREQGYAALWVRDVRIDYRTAFSCTNPFCAPHDTQATQAGVPLHRAA